jgi:hypothetical protein
MINPNLLANRFLVETEYRWPRLLWANKEKWLAIALDLANRAFAWATRGTDIKAPTKYDDFKCQVLSIDGDQLPAFSKTMYYAKFDKKCRNEWNPVEVKDALDTLFAIFKVRDTGKW